MKRTTEPERFAVHGYLPIRIDAGVLTPEERAECSKRAMSREKMSWREYLTAAEREEFDRQLAQLHARPSRVSAATNEAIYALISRAARLAEARLMFNGGRPVWYGDGTPPAPDLPKGGRGLPLGVTLGLAMDWAHARNS